MQKWQGSLIGWVEGASQSTSHKWCRIDISLPNQMPCWSQQWIAIARTSSDHGKEAREHLVIVSCLKPVSWLLFHFYKWVQRSLLVIHNHLAIFAILSHTFRPRKLKLLRTHYGNIHNCLYTCLFWHAPSHCTAFSFPTSWTFWLTWVIPWESILLNSEPYYTGSPSFGWGCTEPWVVQQWTKLHVSVSLFILIINLLSLLFRFHMINFCELNNDNFTMHSIVLVALFLCKLHLPALYLHNVKW